MTYTVPDVFDRTVAEGERRLNRRWPELLATGAMGGIDVSVGVLALLAVRSQTNNAIASSLAFGVGFIALTLANSELFTENFLVPIAALVAARSTVARLLRLWVAAMVMNLLGGWLMAGIIIGALPSLKPTAVELATHYTRLGIGWTSFAGALLGGAVITLMTWMDQSTEAVGARLTAAVAAAFLLAIGPLNHAIVVSILMFTALHAGAPFGYADWLGMLGWITVGNIVGGLGLVTLLRLIQVGRAKIAEEQQRARPPDQQQAPTRR
jgi:formate/nitrite transporter FocA (FNT family)